MALRVLQANINHCESAQDLLYQSMAQWLMKQGAWDTGRGAFASAFNNRPQELEAADDEQEALTDEDCTDIESVASGRESLLPPVIGKHTGVCKDLATARAREYLMAGKGAIESANNLKREIRAIAVEQLSNLYEMVLSLADSRNRHKLLREEEKCRSAKWSGWNAPTTNNSWKKDSAPRCCCARQRKPGPVPIRR
ncbi:hypothetical protein JYU34_002985 [Plutella xylostella]|uniref:Uncharacterized protein n=1 Tax=Plutella xylostella TaxID=51655 RepID=A0ABQ7R3M8_PLUXY|nr:hypothetical protein JYU34_002985 [Plutella xylostella]